MYQSIASHWSCALHAKDFPKIKNREKMCYRLKDRKDKNSEIIYPSSSDDDDDSSVTTSDGNTPSMDDTP